MCVHVHAHTHTHTCTRTCTHTHTKPVLSLSRVLNTGALEIIHNLNTHSCVPSTFCVRRTPEKLFYMYQLLNAAPEISVILAGPMSQILSVTEDAEWPLVPPPWEGF